MIIDNRYISPQLFLDNNDLNAGLYEGEVNRKWNKTEIKTY